MHLTLDIGWWGRGHCCRAGAWRASLTKTMQNDNIAHDNGRGDFRRWNINLDTIAGHCSLKLLAPNHNITGLIYYLYVQMIMLGNRDCTSVWDVWTGFAPLKCIIQTTQEIHPLDRLRMSTTACHSYVFYVTHTKPVKVNVTAILSSYCYMQKIFEI